MGKLILCSSAVAKTPYKMPVSGTRIYTIEEMCYYIYHNIYEIDTGCFDKKMAQLDISKLRFVLFQERSLYMAHIPFLSPSDSRRQALKF